MTTAALGAEEDIAGWMSCFIPAKASRRVRPHQNLKCLWVVLAVGHPGLLFCAVFLIALISSAATSSVGHFAVSKSQKHQVRSVIVEATLELAIS